MKLFYIVMLTALLGFFGIGCEQAAETGGQKAGAADTPTTEVFFVISSVIRSAVVVESGDSKFQLSIGQCVAVPQNKWAALKVSVIKSDESVVEICSGDACGNGRNVAVRNPGAADGGYQLVDSALNGCTKVLEEAEVEEVVEVEAETEAGAEAQAATDE